MLEFTPLQFLRIAYVLAFISHLAYGSSAYDSDHFSHKSSWSSSSGMSEEARLMELQRETNELLSSPPPPRSKRFPSLDQGVASDHSGGSSSSMRERRAAAPTSIQLDDSYLSLPELLHETNRRLQESQIDTSDWMTPRAERQLEDMFAGSIISSTSISPRSSKRSPVAQARLSGMLSSAEPTWPLPPNILSNLNVNEVQLPQASSSTTPLGRRPRFPKGVMSSFRNSHSPHYSSSASSMSPKSRASSRSRQNICLHCSRTFESADLLQNHIANGHRHIDDVTDLQPLSCPVCGIAFDTRYALVENHLPGHYTWDRKAKKIIYKRMS